jgi:hypothetical protein
MEANMMVRVAILSTFMFVTTCAFGQAEGAPVVASAAQRALQNGAATIATSLITGNVRGAPLVLGVVHHVGFGREGAAAAPNRRPPLLIGPWRGDDDGGAGAWSGAGEPRLALPVGPSISLDLGYRFVTNEDLAEGAFLAAERGLLDPDHVSHSVTIHARWQF